MSMNKVIPVWVNAGAKAVSLSPVRAADKEIDIRVNVATGVSSWVATKLLGKADASDVGAPKVIRWELDLARCETKVTQDGREFLLLDLVNTDEFKAWAREVKPLARVKGAASEQTAEMLAELDAEFGDDDAPEVDGFDFDQPI
jgi:hypothetical protein